MPDDRTSHDAEALTNYHTARADRVGGAVHSGKHVDQPKPDIGDAFNAAVLKLADEIERSCKAPNYEARLGTIEGKMIVAILRQAASQGNVGGEAVREALTLAYHELKKHDADYHHRTSVEVNNKIVDALALSTPVKTGGEAETTVSENIGVTVGCICQNQHRRGHCTEPGCPFSIRPVDAGALHAAAQAVPMRDILVDLEEACQRLAANRPQAVYDAMIDAGQQDCLLALDRARAAARAALAAAPPTLAQASRDVAIEECAKVAESFRRQMLPGDDRVLIRKIEDAIRSLSAVPSAKSGD